MVMDTRPLRKIPRLYHALKGRLVDEVIVATVDLVGPGGPGRKRDRVYEVRDPANGLLRCPPDDLPGLVGKVHAQPTVSIGATPFPILILLIILVLITMLIKLHTAGLQGGRLWI